MNTLREETYDVNHGGEVVVTEEERDHSNTREVRVREYSDDGDRMNFYKFAVNSGDTVNLVTGSTDRPRAACIAAVHRFGYEISNVAGTRLEEMPLESIPPQAFLVYVKRSFDVLQDQHDDSEVIRQLFGGMSYLSKVAIQSLAVYAEAGPDMIDDTAEELLPSGMDMTSHLEGIFSQAVNPTESRRDEYLDDIYDRTADWADDLIAEDLIMDPRATDVDQIRDMLSGQRWRTVDEIEAAFPDIDVVKALEELERIDLVELSVKQPSCEPVAAKLSEFGEALYNAQDDEEAREVYDEFDVTPPEEREDV